MTNDNIKYKSVFRYNMSFYYQSTIVYFSVFALYLLIRGEFVDNSYTLVVKDPILYFLAIIVIVSLFGLLLNLYKKRHIEITEQVIAFVSRSKRKEVPIEKIENIKIISEKRFTQSKALKIIILKLKSRKRRLLIRPSDYENYNDLIQTFQNLKSRIEVQ